MGRDHYKFNPRTLSYEVISLPFRIRFYRLLRKVLIAFILALVVNVVFSFFFYTPKLYSIKESNEELLLKYNLLQDRIAESLRQIGEIKQRDIHVYRAIFAADSLRIPGIYNPYPDLKYAGFGSDSYASLMTDTWRSLDALGRLVYLESKSLDDLQKLAVNKEAMAESIPAISPVNLRDIHGSIGAYGMRRHPISRRYSMHEGIDFAGRRGAPIYATGNGVVSSEGGGLQGYGRQILIDHGFGYKTRYAHLNRISVLPGQVVKRGEKIGEMGNTGRSTGPHLHYEVIYMGQHMNPINFFSRNMSPEEFRKILESAKTITYELD